jgi:surfactin synthase thioesterase subunit
VTGRSPWLPDGAGAGAPLRLVCLPHAGAGAATYRTWGQGLSPDIAFCPVQLPGRETRMAETPYDRVEPLVAELAEVIAESIEPPYALFGHSLGALVAFMLTRRLRELGAAQPVQLIVSGRHAPQATTGLPALAGVPIDQLAVELGKLGGTPADVLANQDLLAIIAPMLRADFAVNENYDYAEQAPLDLPIMAFAAAQDPRAGSAQLAAWRYQTSQEFRLHRLPGGHFAILKHAEFVHARIAEAIAPLALMPFRP